MCPKIGNKKKRGRPPSTLIDDDRLDTKSLAKTNNEIEVSLDISAIDEPVKGLAAVADFISELFLGQVLVLDEFLDLLQQLSGGVRASIEAHEAVPPPLVYC